MRTAEELRLLLDIDRTQRRNRIHEWWVAFKADRRQQFQLGFLAAVTVILVAVVVVAAPMLEFLAVPSLDERALRFLGILILIAATAAYLPDFIKEVREPWDTDLFFVSPLRRRAFVLKSLLDAYKGLAWSALFALGLAALFGYLFMGVGSLLFLARVTPALMLYSLALRNVGYIIGGLRGRRHRRPGRWSEMTQNAAALVVLAATCSLGLQVLRIGPMAVLDSLWSTMQHPAMQAILAPFTLALDVAWFAPPGPLLAAEAAALVLFILATGAIITRMDFQVFEEHDDPGREIPGPRRSAHPLLERLRVRYPDMGEAHLAIASVNLYVEFKKGIAGRIVSFIVVATAGAYLTRYVDFPYGITLLVMVPMIIWMFPAMMAGWSLQWDDPDLMLLMPMDRTRQARSYILSALAYQLIAWYGILLAVTVAGFRFHPVILAITVGLAPFLIYYMDAAAQYFSSIGIVADYHGEESKGYREKFGNFIFHFGELAATMGMAALQALLIWLGWRSGIAPYLTVPPLAVLDLALGRMILRGTGGHLENLTRQGIPRRKKWSISGVTIGAVAGPTLLVVLYILAPLALQPDLPADLPGSAPGLHYDTDTVLNDTALVVPGTLVVGARSTLELRNASVTVDCLKDGESGIYVLGTLRARNCTFAPANGTGRPVFRVKGLLEARDCSFSRLWGDTEHKEGTGGLELHGAGSSLVNCTVSDGETNGVLCLDQARIIRCRILNNSDDGIEFHNEDGDIEECELEFNGRGIYDHGAGQLNITGCEVRSNRGDGVLVYLSDVRMEYSDISENGGYGVHTVRMVGDELWLTGCSVSQNGAGAFRQERFDTMPGFGTGGLLFGAAAAAVATGLLRRKREASKTGAGPGASRPPGPASTPSPDGSPWIAREGRSPGCRNRTGFGPNRTGARERVRSPGRRPKSDTILRNRF